MDHPLEVGGVGSGTQVATHRGTHAVGFGNGHEAVCTAPEIPGSGVPALFGTAILKRSRTALDCYNQRMHQVGPGGYKILRAPGTRTYEL
eukprot:8407932-Karenia_brevis.AAC.1